MSFTHLVSKITKWVLLKLIKIYLNMAKKIATEQYAYNIGVGKGTPTSNLMVTYSRAVALGC